MIDTVATVLFRDVHEKEWDGGCMRILADYCEDQNHPDLAFALRWMDSKRFRPMKRDTYHTGRAVPERFRWGWWYAPQSRGDSRHIPSELPRFVFVAFWRYRFGHNHFFYGDAWAAVTELSEALERIRNTMEIRV